MLKKIVLFISFLIGCIFLWRNIPPLWIYYFPHNFEQKLAASIEQKCRKQKDCIIRLHEITPFQWDKAYFFAYDSGDKNYIAKVTGMQGDFRQNGETSFLFIKDGKLVKYEKFVIIQDYDEPVFPWSVPYVNVYISFITGKYRLKELNYPGNLDDFLDDSKGYVGINYYELTPQNDQLYAGCGMKDINQISFKQCALSFTNLDQVKLFNPKTDNN